MSRFAWMSSPQYLAQVGHFLGGALLVFACGAFWGHRGAAAALSFGAIAAALKEFVFDVAPWGEGDSWADSAEDFAFYILGGVAGAALFGLALAQHVVFR